VVYFYWFARVMMFTGETSPRHEKEVKKLTPLPSRLSPYEEAMQGELLNGDI